MPFDPSADDGAEGHFYDVITFWDKLVADYAGVSMVKVQNFDLVTYLTLRRDAFISQLNKTEDGKKYLENAWVFEQTDADYEGIYEVQKIMSRRGG